MASEGYRKVERYGLSDGRADHDDEQHVVQHLSADKAPSASDMDKFCIDYFKALHQCDPLAAATGTGPQRMQKIKRPTAAQASRFPFMNLQQCHIDAMAPPFRDALQGMRLPGEAFDTYYKMARDRNAARKKKEERKKHATAERRAQWTTTVLEMNIKDPGDFYARLVLPEDMTCTQLKAVLFCVFGVETPDSGLAKSDLIARLRKEMADNPDKLPRRLDYSQCPARSTNKDHSCTSVCPLPEAVLLDKPADIPLPRPPKAVQVQDTDDAQAAAAAPPAPSVQTKAKSTSAAGPTAQKRSKKGNAGRENPSDKGRQQRQASKATKSTVPKKRRSAATTEHSPPSKRKSGRKTAPLTDITNAQTKSTKSGRTVRCPSKLAA
jgi:hypothetical protein